MTLHILWTNYTRTKLPVLWCPTCQKRRRMLAQFQDWYGWYTTCLSCGDQWNDGEMLERPFAPRWRSKNTQEAKETWAIYKVTRQEAKKL